MNPKEERAGTRERLTIGIGRPREEGVITFSIAIYTLIFVILVVAMLEVQRYHGASTILEQAMEVSSLSALAEYDPYLLERWGLLALRQDADPNGSFADAMAINTGSMGAALELDAVGRQATTYGASGASAEAVKGFNLGDKGVFKTQIIDFARESVPLALAAAFDNFQDVEQAVADKDVDASKATDMLNVTGWVIDEALLLARQLDDVRVAANALEQHNVTMSLRLSDLNDAISRLAEDRQHYHNYVADEGVANRTVPHAESEHNKAVRDKNSAEGRKGGLATAMSNASTAYDNAWNAYSASSWDLSSEEGRKAEANAWQHVADLLNAYWAAKANYDYCCWQIEDAKERIRSTASAIAFLNGDTNKGSAADAKRWEVSPGFKEDPIPIKKYPETIADYKNRVEKIDPQNIASKRDTYSTSMLDEKAGAIGLMTAYNDTQYAKAVQMGGGGGRPSAGSLEELRKKILEYYYSDGIESGDATRSRFYAALPSDLKENTLPGFAFAMCSTMVPLTDVNVRLSNYTYVDDGGTLHGFNLDASKDIYNNKDAGVDKQMRDYVQTILDDVWNSKATPMSSTDSRYYRPITGFIPQSEILTYLSEKPKEIYPADCDLRTYGTGVAANLDREGYPSVSASCRANLSETCLKKLGITSKGSVPNAAAITQSSLSSLYSKLKGLDSFLSTNNLLSVFQRLKGMVDECDKLLRNGMLGMSPLSNNSDQMLLAGYAAYNTINRIDKSASGADAQIDGTSFTTLTGFRGAAAYRERDDAARYAQAGKGGGLSYTGGGNGLKGGLSYTSVKEDASWSSPVGVAELCSSLRKRSNGSDEIFNGAELEYVICGSPDETYNQAGTFFAMTALCASRNIEFVMGDLYAQHNFARTLSFGYPVYLVMLMLEDGLRDANALVAGLGVDLTRTPQGASTNKPIDLVGSKGLSELTTSDPNASYASYGREANKLSYRDVCFLIAWRYMDDTTLLTRLQNLVKIETSYYYTHYCDSVASDKTLSAQGKQKYASRTLKTFDLNKSYTLVKCSASASVIQNTLSYLVSPEYNSQWDPEWYKASYTIYRGY